MNENEADELREIVRRFGGDVDHFRETMAIFRDKADAGILDDRSVLALVDLSPELRRLVESCVALGAAASVLTDSLDRRRDELRGRMRARCTPPRP